MLISSSKLASHFVLIFGRQGERKQEGVKRGQMESKVSILHSEGIIRVIKEICAKQKQSRDESLVIAICFYSRTTNEGV